MAENPEEGRRRRSGVPDRTSVDRETSELARVLAQLSERAVPPTGPTLHGRIDAGRSPPATSDDARLDDSSGSGRAFAPEHGRLMEHPLGSPAARAVPHDLASDHVPPSGPARDLTELASTLGQRRRQVETLVESLRASAHVLEELERDLVDGEATHAELQRRITRSTAFADLADAQVAEVRELMALSLTEVVRAGNRRGFWQGVMVEVVVGAVFFVLGLGVTLIL